MFRSYSHVTISCILTIVLLQSLRVVPEDNNRSTVSSAQLGTPAEHTPALHDVLKSGEGPVNVASMINNRHPLESRVQNWERNQQESRMEMYRRTFGAAEPIKRSMELAIVDATEFRPLVLGVGASDCIHREILLNRDASVDWEDIYTGGLESGVVPKDFHSEMEKRMEI